MDEKLENLGWNDFFESQKTEMELDGFSVARVVAEHRGAYKVRNEKGEFLARITGKQIFNATSRENYPVVGDWVVIEEIDNNQATIKEFFPRKSIIKRRFGDKNKTDDKNDIQIIAANVDVAFVVQSFGRDFNINRLERYLAVIKDSDIKPAIILNKTDLISADELSLKLEEIKSRLGDADVILTSAAKNEGLDELKNFIQKGKTYCFLGSSGVGKSSLINKLLGGDSIKTGDVGLYSKRGKHVTTSREIYFLPQGGIVIDNPGIREVGITNVEEGVGELFHEITELSGKCKYADCSHVQEPGCAILEALEKGMIDKNRYLNYVNLKKEADYFNMSNSEKREKNRDFGKFMKKAKKDLRKFGIKDY